MLIAATRSAIALPGVSRKLDTTVSASPYALLWFVRCPDESIANCTGCWTKSIEVPKPNNSATALLAVATSACAAWLLSKFCTSATWLASSAFITATVERGETVIKNGDVLTLTSVAAHISVPMFIRAPVASSMKSGVLPVSSTRTNTLPL